MTVRPRADLHQEAEQEATSTNRKHTIFALVVVVVAAVFSLLHTVVVIVII